MGTQCSTQKAPRNQIDRLKKLAESQGYTVLEVIQGTEYSRLKESQDNSKQITCNQVLIVINEKKEKYALKTRPFQTVAEKQGLCAQAGTLTELRHPHFMKIFSSFTSGNYFFSLMEYQPTTLRMTLRKRSLSKSQQARMASELVEGVQFIHSQGHTHRELKSQNIMVSNELSIAVCDFGLELDCMMRQKMEETSSSSDKWYLAPEIRMSTESIYYQQSKDTDIWALGLIIAEIFGWQYASIIDLNSKLEEIQKELYSESYILCFKELDPKLHPILERMLHPNANKRGQLEDYTTFFKTYSQETTS